MLQMVGAKWMDEAAKPDWCKKEQAFINTTLEKWGQGARFVQEAKGAVRLGWEVGGDEEQDEVSRAVAPRELRLMPDQLVDTAGIFVRGFMDARGLVEALRGRAKCPSEAADNMRGAARHWAAIWRLGMRLESFSPMRWIRRRYNVAADRLCGWALKRGGMGWVADDLSMTSYNTVGGQCVRVGIWSDGGRREHMGAFGSLVAVQQGERWRVLMALAGTLGDVSVPTCEAKGLLEATLLLRSVLDGWLGLRADTEAAASGAVAGGLSRITRQDILKLEMDLSMTW